MNEILCDVKNLCFQFRYVTRRFSDTQFFRFACCLYGNCVWAVILRAEHKGEGVFGNRLLRNILRTK
jgi:hypothetical protein